jgi:phi13 family phage major tail protein
MATIGLRDVHIAVLTEDTADTSATYEAPEKLVGAISANVNPNTSTATLFADDGPYDSASTLGEISLELNMADIPPKWGATLLGHEYKNGVLVKKAADQPPYVAVGYRSLKSNGKYRYTWLLKGKFAEGEQNNQTKGDSVEYQTPTITGSFVKRDYDDAWQVEADEDDTEINPTTITEWFNDVVDPATVQSKG